MSAHTIPTPHTTGPKKFRPPTRLDESAETQSINQGEGLVVPEHVEYDSDLQLGLSQMNKKISAQVADSGIRAKVIAPLKKASDVLSRVVAKGELKVGKNINKDDVNSSNIVNVKRSREKKQQSEKERVNEAKETDNTSKKPKKKMKPFKFEVGDWISVDSKIFDGKIPGSYSKSNPKRQIGEVTRVWASKNIVQVMWNDKTKSLHKAEN